MDFIKCELGLYTGAIEAAIERCTEILEGIGGVDVDDYLDGVKEHFGNISLGDENLTNQIIAAYFDDATRIIQEKAKELGFSVETEYDANCDCSHIFVNHETIYGEDEIKSVFSDGVWETRGNDPDVRKVIDTCQEAMEQVGAGDDECLEELDKYARNYVEADFDFDEYDADLVKEAYLHETAEWVEENMREDLGKEVTVTYDREQLYVDGKPYVKQNEKEEQIERE